MKIYAIKISSGSNPPGLAPYFLTLNPSDPKATKRYETKDELEHALNHCIKGTPRPALDNAINRITQNGFTILQSKLTEEAAKRLGWNGQLEAVRITGWKRENHGAASLGGRVQHKRALS